MADTTDTLFIVEDNTAPPYTITCKRDGVAIDLSGCTVKVYIQKKGSSGTTNSGHETATVTDATNGVIQYQAQSNDFPDKAKYVADVEVTYGNGTVERLYDQLVWKARNKVQ